MLPVWCVFIAISVRLLGSASYFKSVLRGKTQPNPITWFIWSLTALVAFFAQLHARVGFSMYTTLALGLGPLIICITALIKHPTASHFTPFNITCGVVALVGVALWQATANANLAIVFSILADTFGSIPTMHKSYHHPHTEYALPYALSVCSMVITLATLQQWRFLGYAYPLYIFTINLTIFSTIMWRGSFLKRQTRPLRKTIRNKPHSIIF
ncbi:MAG TPA: hypothetical protein VLG16_04870 [Candidatus Saccharimonadales bacterium]|nr:hypothetical protein [Candidatus Saccharimonadales bacterium]